jgi:hypothetical protein
MGLLNNFSDDLLKLIRNAAQSRNPSANSGAGDTNDVPSWIPQRQQRLPLSFAGPDLAADMTASSSGRPGATFPLPGPADASAATDLSWLPVDWPADPRRAHPPAPTTQNLTTQALRMKGVPEADIAAATGNPDLMKQLIIQHFGPGSTGTPARTGYALTGSSASGGSLGDSGRRVYPETSGLDDTRARRDAPAWGRFMPGNPTGLSAGDINPFRADANNPVRLNGPSGLSFGPGLGASRSPGPIQPLPVGLECQGFPAGCQNGGNFGDNANYYAGRRDLCRDCAIRYLGLQDEPAIIKIETLRRYEKQ